MHYEKEETSNNLYGQLAHFHQWKIQRDQRHKYNDPDVKYPSELLKSSKCVFLLLLLTTTTTMGCCPCSSDPPPSTHQFVGQEGSCTTSTDLPAS